MQKLLVKETSYNLGQRLQLDLPFFLYFLQHFFFLFIQEDAQSEMTQGEYKEGVLTLIKSIFIQSK